MNAQYYKNNSKFLVAADCIIFGFKDKELHVTMDQDAGYCCIYYIVPGGSPRDWVFFVWPEYNRNM